MSALRLGLAGVLILAAASIPAAAQEPSPPAEARSSEVKPLIPPWNLGDRWTVESVGKRLQVRRGGELPAIRPIQWQFALSKFEKSLTRECYRVEIRCLASRDGHPLTTLWIDRDSRALRQISTEIPVPDGYQTMTVSYDFDSGQPGPVLGPLTALPIDVPVLLAGRAKGLQTFHYRSTVGPPESKDLEALAFDHEVEQRIAPIDAGEVRQLLTASFEKLLDEGPLAKSLAEKSVTDIRLKAAGREIRQLWQTGSPWPIYSDNGYCVCRLVSFEAAAPANVKEQP
jgi:hypothetical protein